MWTLLAGPKVSTIHRFHCKFSSIREACYNNLNPSVWADQRNRKVDNSVNLLRDGWITSYPPVVKGG